MNSRNCKRLREFEGIEISSQSSRGDMNSREENSQDFCLDIAKKFGSFLRHRIIGLSSASHSHHLDWCDLWNGVKAVGPSAPSPGATPRSS